MKEFINKIKNMDKTKRIVILFITISFVFIGGFSIYNGVTGNYQDQSSSTSNATKIRKKKILRKLKKKRNQIRRIDQTQKQVNLHKMTVNHQHNQQMKQKQMMKINQIVNHHLQLKAIVKVVVQVILKVLRNRSQSNSGQSSNNQSNNSSTNSSSNQQPTTEKITINIQVIGMGNTMMAGTLNVDKNSNALSVLKTYSS